MTTPIPPFAEARARCESLGGKEWRVRATPFGRVEVVTEEGFGVATISHFDLDLALRRAEFMAAARTDLPAALDEIDTLEREVQALRGECSMAYEVIDSLTAEQLDTIPSAKLLAALRVMEREEQRDMAETSLDRMLHSEQAKASRYRSALEQIAARGCATTDWMGSAFDCARTGWEPCGGCIAKAEVGDTQP